MEEQSPAVPPGTAFGHWLIAGTPVNEPYPCRCREEVHLADGRSFTPSSCNAGFCPCSGRLDPAGPECCAVTNTPERAAMASAAYQLRRARERGILG